MLIKQWQRIWYAIHTAHSPGTDSLFHLSLTSVWEIQTWHSITCGERSAHWSYIQLNSPQALSCLAYHTTFFSLSSYSLEACPAIPMRLITPDICVMMSSDGKFTVREQTCERCIFHVWFSFCVIQRWGMFLRQRVNRGADYEVSKEKWVHICVRVCVCVRSQSRFEKVETPL